MLNNSIVLSTKTEEERNALAQIICDALKEAFANAKEAGLETRVFNPMVNAGTGSDAGKYYVSMSCDKYDPRSVPARRCQIWVTSKGIEIWYGKVFETMFDGDNSRIFTSTAFVERVKHKKNGAPIDNDKERLICFHDVESFIPCVLSLMCDVIEGNERSYDVLFSALSETPQETQETPVNDETQETTQETSETQEPTKTRAKRGKGKSNAGKGDKTQSAEKKPRKRNNAQ